MVAMMVMLLVVLLLVVHVLTLDSDPGVDTGNFSALWEVSLMSIWVLIEARELVERASLDLLSNSL